MAAGHLYCAICNYGKGLIKKLFPKIPKNLLFSFVLQLNNLSFFYFLLLTITRILQCSAHTLFIDTNCPLSPSIHFNPFSAQNIPTLWLQMDWHSQLESFYILQYSREPFRSAKSCPGCIVIKYCGEREVWKNNTK